MVRSNFQTPYKMSPPGRTTNLEGVEKCNNLENV